MLNKKISLILLLLSFFVIIGSVSASEDTNQVVGIVTDNGTVPFNYTEPGYCVGCDGNSIPVGQDHIKPMENNTNTNKASGDTNQVVGIVTDNGTVPFNYTEPGYCGGCGNITPTLGSENIVPMENNTTNHNNSVHTGNEIVCEECNSSRPMTHAVYDNNTNTIIFHCFDEMGNKVINQLMLVTIDIHNYVVLVDKHGVAILVTIDSHEYNLFVDKHGVDKHGVAILENGAYIVTV